MRAKSYSILTRFLVASIIVALLSTYNYYHYGGNIAWEPFCYTAIISVLLVFLAFTVTSKNFLDK